MTYQPLYSERTRSGIPRDVEKVDKSAIAALETVLDRWLLRANRGALRSYYTCYRCQGNYSLDFDELSYIVRTRVPDCGIPTHSKLIPTHGTEAVFDLLELYFEIAKRKLEPGSCPSGRYPCLADDLIGNFISEVNGVFERKKIRYELTPTGRIQRIGAPIVSDLIRDTSFETGDSDLNEMLELAQDKYISRDPAIRREGLEKLWDAWERLKTLEDPSDKKTSVEALLDRVANGPMRERLGVEARELTQIGNKFMIRHSETDRHALTDHRHVDYLFHRLFSLVYLLLDATGRLGRSD